MIDRPPPEKYAWSESVEDRTSRKQILGFVRSLVRFLSIAAILCAVELVRRNSNAGLPGRRMVGTVMACSSAGVLGLLILWRSRAEAGIAREVLESAAMAGFWTAIFALVP